MMFRELQLIFQIISCLLNFMYLVDRLYFK